MNRSRGGRPQLSANRAGFSLAESLISIVLVSVLLVAALNVVGDSTVAQQKNSDWARGQLLAEGLMSEILSQDYEDPEIVDGERAFDFATNPQMSSSPSFGRDSSESAVDRFDFDDVDDYDGWTASPPERKDGTEIPDLTGWERSVTVDWITVQSSLVKSLAATGVKRITVGVTRNGVPTAEFVAIKSVGLPDPGDPVRVLLPVTDPASLTAQESARQSLLVSWGCTLDLIAASETQAAFDAAVADVDVAYISEQVNDVNLGTKLRDVTIGVVNEKAELADEFGFVQLMGYGLRDTVQVTDDTHYITSPFSTGSLTLFSSTQPTHWTNGPLAPDLQTLAETNSTESIYEPSLATLDPGAGLWDGGTAAGKRVQLPWGDAGFDINALSPDGQTIMQRAIEWAAGKEQIAGP